MKATTGLAWWAGTGSSSASSDTAAGMSGREVAVDVAESMQDHVVVQSKPCGECASSSAARSAPPSDDELGATTSRGVGTCRDAVLGQAPISNASATARVARAQ